MKKILSIILTLAMLLPCMTVFAENSEIKVMLDGAQIEFDVQPMIENDRVLVPMRAIFETLGAEVEWDGEIQTAMAKADIYNGIMYVNITVNSDKMEQITAEEGSEEISREIELDAPACIVNDRTLVPLRAVSEAFGCDVQWDGETRTVTIMTMSEPQATAEPTEAPRTGDTFEEKLLSYMPEDKNYMISPFSLKMALAMAANGSDGETREEILKALDINDINTFNEYSKSFIDYIAKAGELNAEADEKRPVFEMANSIWLNKDYKEGQFANIVFSDEFSQIITDYYSGTSDVVNDTDKTEKINGWVSEKTHGKIDGIVDENAEFLSAIVNAIYMKAQWQNQFNESATYKEEFTSRNGAKSEIDFMHKTSYFNYYADGDIQFVEIPYYGGLSMYVALGDAAKFSSTADKAAMTYVQLSLPKFKIESKLDLKDILNQIGITLAFDKQNNGFGKMFNPSPEFSWIESVLQKTYIDVDENGTEAAAVTFVGGGAATSLPPTPIEFKANEPFTYFICDEETGQIFFMGEYAFAE